MGRLFDIVSGGVQRFAHSPWVVAACALVTIGSFFLGDWYSHFNRERPLLTLIDDGKITEIVSSKRSSDLQVSYRGNPIAGPVSARQVVLWNAGQASVKSSEILTPITLQLGTNETRILEANVTRTTRKEVEPKLNTSEMTKGRVSLDWRILEESDGFEVQLIYEGSADSGLSVSGTVEKQKRLLVESKANAGTGVLLRVGTLFMLSAVIGIVAAPLCSWSFGRIMKPVCLRFMKEKAAGELAGWLSAALFMVIILNVHRIVIPLLNVIYEPRGPDFAP